jgi:2OG-Fe(II) oxygenase superfamily
MTMAKRLSLILFVALLFHPNSSSYGLQTSNSSAGNSSSSSCINPDVSSLLNRNELSLAIHKGRVYQQDNFLTETQVQHLLDEIHALEGEGQFITKGLSNTAAQAQQFSVRQDRSICPVPWFVDALQTRQPDPNDRRGVPAKLQQLQLELSSLLNRPTMADDSLNHECYYSLSNVGSFLPRHMDERHEELKGAQGWLLPSRRSLSWLIYLSEPADWDIDKNGGALRTFPQEDTAILGTPETISTHDGNLQVGWYRNDDDKTKNKSQPVYLDSFYVPPGGQEAYCILYYLEREGRKECLTKPWLTEALQGMPVPEFLHACSVQDATAPNNDNNLLLFVSSHHARSFHLIEDRQAWNDGLLPAGSIVEDIAPVRGRLVVFDSVQLPHEVREIKSGTRRALAGWFHEKTQELQIL